MTYLTEKIMQCPNVSVLKSKVLKVHETKTLTKIVILKACILKDLCQQSQFSKI